MKSRHTAAKRSREQAKRERKIEKAERRKQRVNSRSHASQAAGGVDPDIAGIVPGPQPDPEAEEIETPHGAQF